MLTSTARVISNSSKRNFKFGALATDAAMASLKASSAFLFSLDHRVGGLKSLRHVGLCAIAQAKARLDGSDEMRNTVFRDGHERFEWSCECFVLVVRSKA